jgi:putative transposase
VKPPDLVRRDFTAPGPNRLWLGDITYLATDEGWSYLAVLLDVFSRRIVGWASAAHLGTDLPLAALDMALTERLVRPGQMLVHHTDAGSQYLSQAYSRRLARCEILPSAARSAYDNAMCESFFGTIKNELVYRHRWATREAAELAVFHYISWYNQRRRHTSLDMKPPVRYEQEVTTPTLFSQP